MTHEEAGRPTQHDDRAATACYESPKTRHERPTQHGDRAAAGCHDQCGPGLHHISPARLVVVVVITQSSRSSGEKDREWCMRERSQKFAWLLEQLDRKSTFGSGLHGEKAKTSRLQKHA